MNAGAPNACLTEAELEELGNRGDLSPGREAELQKHLEGCVLCRSRWEERRGDEEMLRDLRAARKEAVQEPVTHTRAPSDGHVPPLMLPPELAVTIEGYTITREIGRGGMGVVFEAVQQRLNRKVALKILPGGSSLRDRDAVNRFRREATAAARLHHTHIVPVYDFGQSGVAHYYAMELVEGRSMTDMIRRLAEANAPNASPAELESLLCDATEIEPPGSSGTFNKSDSFAAPGSSGGSFSLTRTRVYYRHVARWMADAADALHYAHDQGIIHRDIKPSNLLLARDGRIMILDFGLAKSQGDHSVTMTGAIVGTLRYMSPEQAMAKRMTVDHRTDIYSLGATLFELLAFQPAFAGHDDKETLGLIITRDATAPRKIISTVPRELETICLKTLEKDPGARYQTARELAEDLRRFIDDRPILARPLGPVGRAVKFMRRRRAATVAAAAIMLLAVSAVGTVWYARKVKNERSERVDKLVNLGAEHMARGEIDKAEDEFTEVLALDPENYRALVNMATVKRFRFDHTGEEARLDEAIELIGRALQKDPSRAEHWNVKGVILRMRDRYDESIRAHEDGIRKNEGFYANWISLANVYVKRGDFLKAEECLLRGTKLAGASAGGMPWCNLAAVQLHLRKPEAQSACDEALRLSGRDVSTMLLYAKLLLTLPDHQNFKKALDAAITADGMTGERKSARVKQIRALAELRMERFGDAIASADEAIALKDRSPYSYLVLCIANARLGNGTKAREYLTQAIPVWPDLEKGQNAVTSVTQGVAWIDSLEDMVALRSEAEGLVGDGPGAAAKQ